MANSTRQLSTSLGVAAAGDVGPRNLLYTFRAIYVCMGALSALAAGIFFQLGRREGPTGPATIVDQS